MPTTPQITLSGTLQDIFGSALSSPRGQLSIQLVGFGSQAPRISGTAMLARTAPQTIQVSQVTGAFSFTLYGNDAITPAGTYYVLQFIDDQGNVVQANAYQFSGSTTVDVSSLTPFNPSVVAVQSGPVVFGALVTVPYNANMVFNAALGTSFDSTLTGSVATAVMSNVNPGTIYTFIIAQDATGGRAWVWPGNVKNAETPNLAANAISVQSFVARANGNLYPIGPMTYN